MFISYFEDSLGICKESKTRRLENGLTSLGTILYKVTPADLRPHYRYLLGSGVHLKVIFGVEMNGESKIF